MAQDRKFELFLKKFSKSWITIAAVFLVIGLAAGWQLGRRPWLTGLTTAVNRIGIQNNPYKFVNPLLVVDVKENPNPALQDKITALVKQLTQQGKVNEVGFYFRDFNKAYEVGLNADVSFYPASLLKVPLMISYYKLAESDPGILAKQILYDGSADANQLEYFKPTQAIEKGKSYSVDQLIEYMIEYSDNNAANLLVANLDPQTFNKVYQDLGIQLPQNNLEQDFLSPKQYSLFFRILRNGTYLNWDYSEKALEQLVYVDFPDGILGGVPVGTLVANKFGEHLLQEGQTQTHELHDCGIIFYPSDSYLLCVMTKGQNYNDLRDVIKQISKLTYNEVSNNFQ